MKKKLKKVERHQRHLDVPVARTRLTRRAWIGAAATSLVVLAIGQRWRDGPTVRTLGQVTVFKSPSCQCCAKWIARMRDYGFAIMQHDMDDVVAIKRKLGIPIALHSCHTSTVEGYSIEGHVPPDLVERVIRERPGIAGLAVPGMPQSAPGMDQGHEAFQVLSFTKNGETAIFATR